MTQKQQQFAAQLKEYQPVPWELIPDLGLYMDQVITYIERQCKELFMEGDRIFTPSMVNNYVKIGLVDRPVAKKYGRDQLAQLLMICVLKQSISSENMKTLVQPPENTTMQAHYETFCQTELKAFSALTDALPLPLLTCAVQGAAFLLLCNTLLARQPEPKPKPVSKDPEPAKPEKKKAIIKKTANAVFFLINQYVLSPETPMRGLSQIRLQPILVSGKEQNRRRSSATLRLQ